MNRSFLMLAKTYDIEDDAENIIGWSASIKYDGQRCFWDGGISRNVPKNLVPWANNDNDERYVEDQICTGLWTRYGNVIHAPIWWLNSLPKGTMLDGELWIERGKFQATRSIVSRIEPDEDTWRKIKYLVFESPSPYQVFATGRINEPQFVEKQIVLEDCLALYDEKPVPYYYSYRFIVDRLRQFENDVILPVCHRKIESVEQLQALCDAECELGGEGIMLRHPHSYYECKRSNYLLKVKPMDDDEGTIIGHTYGENALAGLMGAVVISWQGKQFQVGTGFYLEERVLPSKLFPVGSTLRFRYSGLTDEGIPRHVRYFR